jgi:hypothetical protein
MAWCLVPLVVPISLALFLRFHLTGASNVLMIAAFVASGDEESLWLLH